MCVKLGNLQNWFRPGGKMVTWFRENGDNWFEQLGTELKTQQSLVWQLQHSTESRQNAKIKIVPRYLTSFIYSTNHLMIWSLHWTVFLRWENWLGNFSLSANWPSRGGSALSCCKTDTDCTWSFFPMPYHRKRPWPQDHLRVIKWKVIRGRDPLNGFRCKMTAL